MTPEELEQKIDEQQEQIEKLTTRLDAFNSYTTIPFDVDKAFRERFKDLLSDLKVSAKAAASEDQAVNEAGAGAYDVLGDPVAFLEITKTGTTYYVPYYAA